MSNTPELISDVKKVEGENKVIVNLKWSPRNLRRRSIDEAGPSSAPDLPHPRVTRPSSPRRILIQNDGDDSNSNCSTCFECVLVVITSILLLLAATILTIFWCIYYRDGLKFNEKNKFNFHPVLMTAGCITLSGFAIILYRIFHCCSNSFVKVCHALIQACAITCIGLGFYSIWQHKEQSKMDHFKSLHSWLGLMTMAFFGIQFIIGIFTFFVLRCCTDGSFQFRKGMVPVHATFGVFTFLLGIGTILTGFGQKTHFDLGNNKLQGQSNEETYLNILAIYEIFVSMYTIFLLMMIFPLFEITILSKIEKKRKRCQEVCVQT